MSDIIDRGNEAAEVFLKAALSHRMPEAPAATGWCLNCNHILPEGRWCSRECRDDWQHRQGKQGPVDYDE